MAEISRLKVKSPYKLINIVDVKIENKPNEHGYLYLKCLIDDSINFNFTIKASTDDKICVYEELENEDNSIGKYTANVNEVNENNSKILFNGLVQNVRTINNNEIYYLEIEALTWSSKLDIEEKSRSFQNINMTCSDMINQILSEYPGYEFVQYVGNGEKISKPFFQYKETDWNFLKRIVSELRSDLYCDIMEMKNMFYFGNPEEYSYKLEDDMEYKAVKDLKRFYEAGGYQAGYHDTDYFYYEVERRDIFKIGTIISYKQKELYVREYEAYINNGELIYKYILCRKSGVWQSIIHNKLLRGVSIEGKVIAVQGEYLKVHLNIDEKQNEAEACWFYYAPPTVNVMYSMPLIGTNARLYFPNESKEKPIVIGCARKNGDTCEKTSDTTKRYFETEYGSEISMLPSALNIKGVSEGQLSIILDDNVGITLTSPKKLNLNAGGDIIVKTPSCVNINAKSQILMTKGSSSNGVSIEGEFNILGNTVIKNGSDRTAFSKYTDDEPQAAQPPAPVEKEIEEPNFASIISKVLGAIVLMASPIGNAVKSAVSCIGTISSVAMVSRTNGSNKSKLNKFSVFITTLVAGAALPPGYIGVIQSFNTVKKFGSKKYEFKPDPIIGSKVLFDNEYAKMKIDAGVYNGKFENKAAIIDNGKFSPQLRVGGEEEFKLIDIPVESKEFGNKYLSAKIEASTSVVKEKIDGQLLIGKDEDTGKFDACLKGGAIATLHEGNAKQTFKVLGIELEIEETGYVGGIGGEFKVGIEQNKLKTKIGACDMIGGGISISLGLAE